MNNITHYIDEIYHIVVDSFQPCHSLSVSLMITPKIHWFIKNYLHISHYFTILVIYSLGQKKSEGGCTVCCWNPHVYCRISNTFPMFCWSTPLEFPMDCHQMTYPWTWFGPFTGHMIRTFQWIYGGFHKGGTPKMDGLWLKKSETKMDDK